jgi:hypothetical protein
MGERSAREMAAIVRLSGMTSLTVCLLEGLTDPLAPSRQIVSKLIGYAVLDLSPIHPRIARAMAVGLWDTVPASVRDGTQVVSESVASSPTRAKRGVIAEWYCTAQECVAHNGEQPTAVPK